MGRTRPLVVAVAVALLGLGWAKGDRAPAAGGTVVWTNGKQLVVTGLDGVTKRRQRARWQASARLSSDGTVLAIVDREIRLVDLRSGRTRIALPRGSVDGTLGEAAFSPNGRYLAADHGDERCRRSPGIVVVDLTASKTSRPRLWPLGKPWRRGESTRFVEVLDVADDGGVSFHESTYEFGECRYQALVRDAVWTMRGPAGEPTRIVSDPELGAVAWSPDRGHFAYTIGSGDACELWVADGSGKRARRITEREYVPTGCSRGLSGIPLIWHPSGMTLYYADGSTLWSWDRMASRHRVLVRPPGAPTSNCTLDQSCRDHDVLDISSDGDWILLTQEQPRTYAETLVLVSTKTGGARLVRPPAPGFEPADAQLD